MGAQSFSVSSVSDRADHLAAMDSFYSLSLLVVSFFQMVEATATTFTTQVFWTIGDAGLSCDDVFGGYGTTCDEDEMKDLGAEMNSDYNACEPKFALAGYECGWGTPANDCEPDNCRASGSPYVDQNQFLWGICRCGAGNLPSRCRDVPSDQNNRRLCPCAGSKPDGLCEEFASCHCWGDPHCTLTFWNSSDYSVMDLGLFKYGSNLNRTIEVQGWNCEHPWSGAVIKALAVRAYGHKVTIFNNEVYLDEVQVTFNGSQPAWLTQTGSDGQFTNLDAEDNCWHFTSEAKPYQRTHYHNFHLDIAKQQESSEGHCGGPNSRDPVGAGDAIFSPAELDRLYAECPESPRVTLLRSLSDDVRMASPEEVCQQAESVTYEDASTMCAALIEKNQFYQSCIYDYCASDGAEEMVQNANKSAFHEVERSRLYPRGPITTTTTTMTATTTATEEDAAQMSTLLGLPSSISLVAIQFYMYLSQ